MTLIASRCHDMARTRERGSTFGGAAQPRGV